MTEQFQMTFEIEDRAKNHRLELIVSSTILWYDFQQEVAKKLNIFPLKMELQYRFSNENRSSLPFDLNSHLSFASMCDKLRPFVVPPTLNNGKKSTHKMKLVTIILSVRDGELESQSGGKNSKVSELWTLWVFIS